MRASFSRRQGTGRPHVATLLAGTVSGPKRYLRIAALMDGCSRVGMPSGYLEAMPWKCPLCNVANTDLHRCCQWKRTTITDALWTLQEVISEGKKEHSSRTVKSEWQAVHPTTGYLWKRPWKQTVYQAACWALQPALPARGAASSSL